jgi:hypothetical protein
MGELEKAIRNTDQNTDVSKHTLSAKHQTAVLSKKPESNNPSSISPTNAPNGGAAKKAEK